MQSPTSEPSAVSLDAASSELSALWRDIDTCPAWCTQILAAVMPERFVCAAYRDEPEDDWRVIGFDASLRPTHWMPLPYPPHVLHD